MTEERTNLENDKKSLEQKILDLKDQHAAEQEKFLSEKNQMKAQYEMEITKLKTKLDAVENFIR